MRQAAIIVLLALTPAAAGQCPGEGDCCIPNGTSGCNDNVCCLVVCADDPFCCDVQWDFNCAASAAAQCAACNAGCPGTGNCCSENGTPGCDNTFCCGLVCTANPFCCEFGWDALCAQEAGVLCAICIPPPVCPGGGNCCAPNGSPSCDDEECCLLVCAVDEFCCQSLWDNTCAAEAADLCSTCAPVCADPVLDPAGTGLSTASALPGDQLTVTYHVTNASTCEFQVNLVCLMEPFSGGPVISSPECEQVVAVPAGGEGTFTRCFNIPPAVLPGLYGVTYRIADPGSGAVLDEFAALDLVIHTDGDLTGDGTVGIVDFLLLLDAWGPCAFCAQCPADLDGDCAVGINDMLMLLANWG